ncbi:TraB/GumN family protein [Alkalihalobacterium sp. APHAB7]|uniref:TraB/GumN family protein n=1 Tax=Alkalihalobacterium sp. APHAB7 TaxID=3402081 RepID=UPI003AADAAAF
MFYTNWEVNNDKTTVYLLGSFHNGSGNMYPMRKKIEDAFQSSNYLVLEIDSTNEDFKVLYDTSLFCYVA